MNQRLFAVIGHPIGHTMSPFIHSRLFELSGMPAEYRVYDIAESELVRKMPELKALNGFNITIPHKQSIIPFLDRTDKKAARFGSVNTVHSDGGVHVGYTTDPDGFLMALKSRNVSLKGRTLISGSGGAARVMAFEAAEAGGSVTLAVRPHGMPKAEKLVQDIRCHIGNADIRTVLLDEISGSFDLLANATPVGMYPNTEASPVNNSVLKNCAAVFDAVYNPDETLLLRKARENGAQTIGGMDMLVWQAVKAHEIWDSAIYDPADIKQLSRDSVEEMNKIFGSKA